jgi:hypothetical protein
MLSPLLLLLLGRKRGLSVAAGGARVHERSTGAARVPHGVAFALPGRAAVPPVARAARATHLQPRGPSVRRSHRAASKRAGPGSTGVKNLNTRTRASDRR